MTLACYGALEIVGVIIIIIIIINLGTHFDTVNLYRHGVCIQLFSFDTGGMW